MITVVKEVVGCRPYCGTSIVRAGGGAGAGAGGTTVAVPGRADGWLSNWGLRGFAEWSAGRGPVSAPRRVNDALLGCDSDRRTRDSSPSLQCCSAHMGCVLLINSHKSHRCSGFLGMVKTTATPTPANSLSAL